MTDTNIEQENFDTPTTDEDVGMDPSEIKSGGKYIKNPAAVGDKVFLNVIKIDNKQPTTIKKKDGTSFDVGMLDSITKERMRLDIVCPDGSYTIPNWEVYGKLFGPNGLLTEYANRPDKIAGKSKYFGAQIEITKLVDASPMTDANLRIVKGFKNDAELIAYKTEVKKATTEKRLYDVKLLN